MDYRWIDAYTKLTSTVTMPDIQVTVTATPPATLLAKSADCQFWNEGWGYWVEIYNIQGWASDGGQALHHEESGCGLITTWQWNDATDFDFPFVYFSLPLTRKGGCMERAIVSAGGPKLTCLNHGRDWKRSLPSTDRDEGDGVDAANQTHGYIGRSRGPLRARSQERRQQQQQTQGRRGRLAKRTHQTLRSASPYNGTHTPSYSYSDPQPSPSDAPWSWPSDDGAVALAWSTAGTTEVATTTATPGSGKNATTATAASVKHETIRCDIVYQVAKAGTCADLASAAGISLIELHAWNPYVGDDCENIVSGDYICIAGGFLPVPTMGTTFSSAPVMPPSLTSTGMSMTAPACPTLP